ncbi:Protein of unknown function DUF1262 [Macleaya cordata]|uniref:Uncharacterized protein n=1 Tax=Macleaya cordata TaxID=56857 RepID=A0A200Q7K7_MACCD|nr:Protein of unknown function DUF1262 [Macleaya cordata]
MYATRALSAFRRDPRILSNITVQEEQGPKSGYLVITDQESEEEDTCCWGACKVKQIKDFPFPSNKIVNVIYTQQIGENTTRVIRDTVWFIPVLDQPLSSNRYYVVTASGKHTGQTCTCSREEDKGTCCFCCEVVKDVKPRVLDHRDIYQQVEIFKRGCGGFVAKSVAPDGFPPQFLRREGWTVRTTSSYDCQLGEALGLNDSLRMRLPELIDFPISNKYSTPVVVGRTWEEIYTCKNDYTAGNVVAVNATVQREAIKLFGEEAMKDGRGGGVDGFIWYRHVQHNEGGSKLGLSLAIVEKMRWIQDKGGWVGGGESDVKVEKEFKGGAGWNSYGSTPV